jgi:3-oxo-5-alpha-steroid 4-dehydrogenase 1
MAPIHIVVWATALSFQLCNAICLGSWLSAYGVVTESGWETYSSVPQFVWGLCVFYFGLVGNWLHDEELREIRRKEQRRQDKIRKESNNSGDGAVAVEKHYEIPSGGLFKYMLYPHYFCEWIEWLGFFIAAGWGCAPARAFLINEVTSMLPRAVNGKKWYVEKFGEDKVRKKWVVLPGVW